MGADIVELSLKGKANGILIKRKIERLQAINREENGHCHGYSGDWQRVDSIKIIHDIFKNKSDAEAYLNDTLEKWGPAIVVYYLTKDPMQPTIKTIVQAMVAC